MSKSFELSFDLKKFSDKTFLRMDSLVRGVAIKTFSSVIKDTPVGNPDLWQSLWKDSEGRAHNPPEGYVGGRLRANWNCSIQMADTSTTFSTDYNLSLSNLNSTVNSGDRNSIFWLSNSLPYVATIEYDSHSKQAPMGMVRRNIIRIKRNIAEKLKSLKSSS